MDFSWVGFAFFLNEMVTLFLEQLKLKQKPYSQKKAPAVIKKKTLKLKQVLTCSEEEFRDSSL